MSFAILLSICNLLFKWKGDVVQYSITLQKTKQKADVGSRHEWLGRSSLEQEHHKRGLRRNWISPLGVEVIPCLSASKEDSNPWIWVVRTVGTTFWVCTLFQCCCCEFLSLCLSLPSLCFNAYLINIAQAINLSIHYSLFSNLRENR